MNGRETPDRWTLIRDMLVFQVKLFVDGIRDLILVPVSLVVGVVSLFRGGERPGTEFYELLRYGRHTDHAINLFGAADPVLGREDDEFMPNIDDVVGRVEAFLVDEYRRGGITAQAKERLDRALDAINRRHAGRDRPDAAGERENGEAAADESDTPSRDSRGDSAR